MSAPQRKILIIGSGVIGLTIAHVLSEKPKEYSITIIARDLPEDLDSQQWSSPWAGALIERGNSTSDERTKRWRAISLSVGCAPIMRMRLSLLSVTNSGT